MKLFVLLFVFSMNVFAQDPKAYVLAFDSKVYSLRTSGAREFVVEVESSKLTEKIKAQGIFGDVKELSFKVYWTASPERIAIEVVGLPEGFREIKEELKASLLAGMENLLPISYVEKFSNFKFQPGTSQKEVIVTDPTNLSPITTYTLKFDANDILTEIVGTRIGGTFNVLTSYAKAPFAPGKYILKKQITKTEENGQKLTSVKSIDYDDVKGIGIVEEVEVVVTQELVEGKVAPVSSEETIKFKNWKVNSGEALKHFLIDSKK